MTQSLLSAGKGNQGYNTHVGTEEEETLESEIFAAQQPQQPHTNDYITTPSSYRLLTADREISRSANMNVPIMLNSGSNFRAISNTLVVMNRCIMVFTVMCLGLIWLLTGFDDRRGKSTMSQMASIFLPLIVYIGNGWVCYYFDSEATTMRNEGYSRVYEHITRNIKNNFGLISFYFVFIFSIYCFILHDGQTSDKISEYTRSWIACSLWTIGFLLLLYQLFKIERYATAHNTDKPLPDMLGQADPITSGGSYNTGPTNNPEKVIEKLYNERKALAKQLENTNKELIKMKKQYESHNPNNNKTDDDSKENSNNTFLEKKIRELEDNMRIERQTITNLKAEIDTQKTMLDAKSTECDQQRSLLQIQEAKLSNLNNERERINRIVNEYEEQIQHLNSVIESKDGKIDRMRKKQKQRDGMDERA